MLRHRAQHALEARDDVLERRARLGVGGPAVVDEAAQLLLWWRWSLAVVLRCLRGFDVAVIVCILSSTPATARMQQQRRQAGGSTTAAAPKRNTKPRQHNNTSKKTRSQKRAQPSPNAPAPAPARTSVTAGALFRGGNPGRAPSIAAWRAASTGSWPANGVVVSKSWKRIIANE